MRTRQQGGALGTIIILILLAAGAYYAYTEFMAPEAAPPSCKAQLNACIGKCRKSQTEAPAMQACQDACQRDAAACK